MSHSEEPDYQIIYSEGTIEQRQYAPMILAEVKQTGERKEAIKKGFRILADYIFGNNILNKKMKMTIPVMQTKDLDGWTICFFMSSSYDLDTLPKPIHSAIRVHLLSSRKVAVIRFSGSTSDHNLLIHEETLQQYLVKAKLATTGPPIFAFYTPPWTFPFLRRNEIMIEIKGSTCPRF